MIETMEDAGGTGLAAPQVHMPYRIVVFRVGGERLTDLPGDSEQDLTVLINPVIEPDARVVQHECGHLDGILYPQRMTDHRLLMFVEEWQRHPIDLPAFLAGEAAT
jgi:peptide deformylase